MDLLRIPELFVTYLDFLLDFAVGPQKALQPFASAAELDATLFLFLLAGATSAYFMIFAADKAGLKPDRESVKDHYGPIAAALLASDLDSKLVPLVSVFLIYPAAILFHLSARLGGLLVALIFDTNWILGGTVRDTINASFAFGSFFLPIWALTIILISWRARAENSQRKPKVNFWLSAGISAGIFTYFPWALAGTHTDTTYGQAFFAFSFGIGGWLVLVAVFLQSLAGMLRALLRAGSFVHGLIRRP